MSVPESVGMCGKTAREEGSGSSVRSSCGGGVGPAVKGRVGSKVEIPHNTLRMAASARREEDVCEEGRTCRMTHARPIGVDQGEAMACPLHSQSLQTPRWVGDVASCSKVGGGGTDKDGCAVVLMGARCVGCPKAGVTWALYRGGRHIEPQVQVSRGDRAPSQRPASPRLLHTHNICVCSVPHVYQPRDPDQRGQASDVVCDDGKPCWRRSIALRSPEWSWRQVQGVAGRTR